MGDQITTTSEWIAKGVTHVDEFAWLAYPRKTAMRITITLRSTQQGYQRWTQDWFKNVNDFNVHCEKLWGEQGWAEIQDLLRSVSEVSKQIVEFDPPSPPPKTRTRWVFGSLSRTNGSKVGSTLDSCSLISLAEDLERAFDVLWTYCGQSFEGRYSYRMTKGGSDLEDQDLSESIERRAASLELYRKCHRTRLDCSLDIDSSGVGPDNRESFLSQASMSARTASNLIYHLSTRENDTKARMQVIIRGVSKAATEDARIKTVWKLDICEVTSEFISCHDLIRFQSIVGEASLFRVIRPLTPISSAQKTESLAEILAGNNPRGMSPQFRSLTIAWKIELASKVAKTGFHLLGTPWLGLLNSEHLQRTPSGETDTSFLLETRTLDLDDIALEEATILSESDQLFAIGVLLVEIALESPDHGKLERSDLEISRILARVRQAMGMQYYQATAFCLLNRKQPDSYDHLNKYWWSRRGRWEMYLMNLLRQYHARVVVE